MVTAIVVALNGAACILLFCVYFAEGNQIKKSLNPQPRFGTSQLEASSTIKQSSRSVLGKLIYIVQVVFFFGQILEINANSCLLSPFLQLPEIKMSLADILD